VRQGAAEALLEALAGARASVGGSGVGVGARGPSDEYVLKRLVKGLASSRQAARRGFAGALAGLLEGLPGANASEVLELMDTHLLASKRLPRQEVSERQLGQVFGLAAIVRSGMLRGSREGQADVAARLLALAREKVFLREPVALALAELMAGCARAEVGALLRAPGALGEALAASEGPTSEGLFLALVAADLMGEAGLPAGAVGAYLPDGGTAAFFTSAHLAFLAPAFQAATFCHPRMHSVWARVLCLLVPGLALGDDGWPDSGGGYQGEATGGLPEKEHLRNFWGEVVEGCLLSSSAPRQFAAVKMAAALLPYLDPSLVPLVFSPQFSKFLKKNVERKDNHLHQMAVWLVARLEEYCAREDTPGRVSAALRLGVLQTCKGSGLGNKGVADAGEGAGEGASLAFLGSLEELFLEEASVRDGAEGDTEDIVAREKSKIVRQMCDLSRSKAATAAVRDRVLKFMAKAALSGDLPTALQHVVSEKLVELLSGLVRPAFRPSKGGGGAERASGDSDTDDLLSKLAAHCRVCHTGATETNDDVAAKLAAMAAAAKKGASGDVTAKALALEQLALVLVVVHLADPEGEVGDVAEDLAVVAEKALSVNASHAKKGRKKAVSADEPAWQDVLVDILLSFLTQRSAALRTCVTAVWRAFCGDVTAAGLKSITDVLTQGGSRPEDGEGSEDDEMEGEEEDGDDGGEEEESDDSEDSGDGVAAAGITMANGSHEKAGGGSDSEGDSMDDEAMFRMDEAIASHLKLARGAQKAAKERRQELTNFKFRALGLVEDYIKFKPDSTLTPNIVWPLLQSLSSAFSVQDEAAFAKKLSSVLSQKLLKARAGKNLSEAERSQASEALAQALEMAVKWKHIELSRTAAAASLYLLKVTESGEGAADSGAGKALEEALGAFFTKKNCRVQQGFFENVFGRHPDLAVKAAPSLFAALESPRSDFMRISALRLTYVSLKTAGGQMPAGLQSSLAEPFVACCAAEYKQKGHAEKALKDGSRILSLAQAHFPSKVSAVMRQALLQALEREAAGSSKSQATAKRLLVALSANAEAEPKKRKSSEDGGPQKAAKSKKMF